MAFKNVKRTLRRFESKKYVQPLDIKRKGRGDDEEWSFAFDKLVMYKNTENQDRDHIFKASTPLDCELHAEVLRSALKHDFPEVDFTVEVKPKYKTLPIPLLEIPIKIPFTNVGWHKAPNKVRDDDFLATIPTTVKISAKGNLNTIEGEALWESLNKIACLHTANSKQSDGKVEVLSHKTSQRASKNPLRWTLNVIGRVLSCCIPEPVLHYCIPISLKRLSRTYPYGHPAAHTVLDTPVINGGAIATAASIGSYAAFGVLLCCSAASGDRLETRRLMDDSPALPDDNILRPKMRYADVHVNNIDVTPFKDLIFPTHVYERDYDNNLLFFNKTPDPHLHQSGNHAPFATRTIIKQNI